MPDSTEFLQRIYSLKVGAKPEQAQDLFTPSGRARWLDSWGAGEVPGLSCKVDEVRNARGTLDTLVMVVLSTPLTPEEAQQHATITLNFYHQLLHWERAIHFYLAEKRLLSITAVNDIATLKLPPFLNDDDIALLVQEFEFSLLPSSLWRHPQHLTIILWYLLNLTPLDAEARFRDCTKRFIARYPGFGRYSETITMFWIRWVKAWLRGADRSLAAHELCNELIQSCAGAQIIYDYYSPKRLFGPESWEVTTLPDLKPFDFEPAMTPPGHVVGFRPFVVPVLRFTTPFPVEARQVLVQAGADGSTQITLTDVAAAA